MTFAEFIEAVNEQARTKGVHVADYTVEVDASQEFDEYSFIGTLDAVDVELYSSSVNLIFR